MIRKVLFLFSLSLLVTATLMAQQEVTGKVLDENNEPILGANVVIKGTTVGTVTNVNGEFAISASSNDTLVVSFIGYVQEEVEPNGQTNIEVVLLPDLLSLQEVVVTALGIKREKKALGYAVQDVKEEDLTASGDPNIATALQGKVAGVVINESGSGLGGTQRIEIRGASSLSDNNQPLIVVDGVPFNSDRQSEAGIWGGYEMSGGLSDINPQDIENISVLKGPNAAALYGSRAGNGVILITTKKGSKGVNINYTGNVTVSDMAYYLDLQDVYGQGSQGVYDKNGTASWGPKMEGQMLESWTGEAIPYTAQTNRLRDFTQTGVSQNHNLSLSTASDKGTLRVAIGKSLENGVYRDHTLDKSNFDLRGQYDVTNWLNVDAKASYYLTEGSERPGMGYYSYISYFNAMPMNIRSEDLAPGYDIGPTGDHVEKLYTTPGPNYRNPYFQQEQAYNNDQRYRGFGYLAANIKFTDYLKLRVKHGLDFFREGRTYGNYYVDNSNKNGLPDYNTSQAFFKETNTEALLSFNKEFNEIEVSVNAGANRMYTYREDLTGTSGKIPEEGSYFLGYGTNIKAAEVFNEQEVQSVYGSAQLGYGGMVYLDVTARNDWSSTLPIDNNSYFYPSVGMSAVISEMIAMPNWFDFAKIRGSWAEVGKGTDPYNVNQVYEIQNLNFDLLNVIIPVIKVNENLQPEISSSIEFGTDMRFFQNRIGLDFTYYDEQTKNQIFRVPTDQSTGYNEKLINAGLITNKGIEILLNTTPVRTKDFVFDVNFNFAQNTTILEELDEELKVYTFGALNNGVAVIGREGEKLGDIRGSVYSRDDNGNIIAGADGLPMVQDSAVTIGNIQPDFTGSIQLRASYKGIYLSALLSGQQGGEIYSYSEQAATSVGNSVRTLENERISFFFDGPLEDGGVNTTMISAQDYWGRVAGVSEEFIYDASYLKLRELAIGYSLPSSLLNKIPSQPIKNLKISFVGRNLLYFYKHTPGTIPDASAYSSSYAAQAFDFAPVPSTRTYGFSINVGF